MVTKPLIYVSGILVLVLCVDFYSRVLPSGSESAELLAMDSAPAIPMRLLPDGRKERINSRLSEWDVKQQAPKPVSTQTKPVNEKPKPFIMDAQSQLRQNGDLIDLYDGNNKYKLVATFDDGVPFALINKHNLVSGKQESIKINKGEALSMYTLAEVTSKNVVLTHEGRVVTLQLFLPTT